MARAIVTLLATALGLSAVVALSALPMPDAATGQIGWLPSLLAVALTASGAFACLSGLALAMRTGAAGALLASGAAAALAAGAIGVATGVERLDLPLVLGGALLLGATLADRADAILVGRAARIGLAAVLLGIAELGVLAELIPEVATLLEPLRSGLGMAAVAVGAATLLASLGRRLDGASAVFLLGATAMAILPADAASIVGLPLLGISQLVAGGALLRGFEPRPDTDETRNLPPLAASLSDAVLHFDGRLRLADWNPPAHRLLGLRSESRGTRLEDLLGVTVADLPAEDVTGTTIGSVAGLELRLHRYNGGIAVIIPDPGTTPDTDRLGRELRGTIEELLAARRTIELQRAELERASSVDPLTGVASRSAIIERLAVEVAQARRYQHPVAVVQIDLDNFAALNGDHGIEGGDAVLREVALRTRLRVRAADALGRAGSDGFLAILPHTDEAGAAIFANALRERLAQRPIAVGEANVEITVSVGVAVMRAGEELDLDGLLGRVHEALESARGAGGDRIALDRLHGLARLEERRPPRLPGSAGEDQTAQDSGI